MRNYFVFGASSADELPDEEWPDTALPDEDEMNAWFQELKNQGAQSSDGADDLELSETDDRELSKAFMEQRETQMEDEIVKKYKLDQMKEEEEERTQTELKRKGFKAMLEYQVQNMPPKKKNKATGA